MSQALVPARLDAFIVARLATGGRARRVAEVVQPLYRFRPREQTDAEWQQTLTAAIAGLRARGLVDAALRVPDGELARQIGATSASRWPELAERVLPALALQIDASDTKTHARLAGRDAWAAAIVARALGVWRAGPPPALGAACDALVWQALGLAGDPRPCPAELRAYFVRQRAGGDAGPPERLVRMHAALLVDAPRPELGALRESLVRMWLAGGAVGVGPASPPRSAIADAQAAANAARTGRFGGRKVFISAVWETLRATPVWASLELDELKAQLVTAHRRGEIVLARADLVAAMDPALVAASETQADGATFHFIVRESST
ncbi:MAG TPA: hypothetical protein VNO30_34665 [Kofleriaceae bacterium]|nr:hypothetical protein [Kofleriaceae bacterium]